MTGLSRRNFLVAGVAGLALAPVARLGAAVPARVGRGTGVAQVALAADHAWFDPVGDAIPCRFALRPTVRALPDVDLAWLAA